MKLPKISEEEFQQQVIQLAKLLGWEFYHTHDSQRSQEGFPDLVLVRERIVHAELKSETGTLSKAQEHWRDRLRQAGAEYYLWTPRDWALIERVLKRN